MVAPVAAGNGNTQPRPGVCLGEACKAPPGPWSLQRTRSMGECRAKRRSDAASPKRHRSWQDVSIVDIETDNGVLVTNINQTQDLMRLENTSALFAGMKATDDWMKVFCLENLHLTLEDLMQQGSVLQNGRQPSEHIQFDKEAIKDFESQLYKAIELYDKRVNWLLQGSRKMFGIIQGSRVGVLIDSSDISCGPRLRDFQNDLLSLIDEQLCYMKQLYFISFGTEVSSLWKLPKAISVDVLQEAREWVKGLKPNGGCNLLRALKKTLVLRELDSLVIIVGSCPDQSPEILSDYIQQFMPGRILLVHTVAYECSNQVPPAVLRSIVDAVGGRYHCCASSTENAMECLQLGAAPAGVLSKSSHGRPLAIQMPNLLAQTSAEWLKVNGLKAKKLSLYQVLAPNAFSPVEEFVPILRKTVSSTVYEKAMMPFEWHDGTVKNVHVDPPILYDYQKQLGRMVRLYERRIEWLSMASRRIWGTVCERRVALLVDVSLGSSMYILHIQHALRLLLEEQMARKDCFNILAFGNNVKVWQPEMVPPHQDNLQSAWKWGLTLQCEGSRNIMNVLRRVVEVDFKDKDKHKSQGVYLLTTGIPDQEVHLISSYMAEVCGGCDLRLHVCLFSVDGFPFDDNIPPRYASLNETAAAFKEILQAANGRFHWFGETGIYESDDISIIMSEMEKAVNYSRKFQGLRHRGAFKNMPACRLQWYSFPLHSVSWAYQVSAWTQDSAECALLVESLKQRSGSQLADQLVPKEELTMLEKKEKSRPQKLPSPKPTALSLARMNLSHDSDSSSTLKALSWRPPSARAEIPPAQPISKVSLANRRRKSKSRKQPEVSLSLFYTDKGKNVGAVYKKYSNPKCVKKSIPNVTLPKEQDTCSSKEWLSRFSIKKLKLELPSLIFGPECVHQKKMVDCLRKKVSAKYCDVFPSVEMNGIVKHLQVQPKVLEEYIEQMEKVLRCYIQRVQWLLSGSRRLFGVILEANVCILIDTSGSMEPSLEQVTQELTSLIWEQLRKNSTKFNLISFAEDVDMWQECLVDATDESCHDAVQWVSTFQAHGNTTILKALRRAFGLQGVEALYVLTDGKPDTSCRLVLKEIEMLLKEHAVRIHTVSFNCSDREAIDFLKKLACQTGGRYHQCHGAVDGQLAAHRMLTEGFSDKDDPVLPLFEGDDLKTLAEEIEKARNYRTQAKFFSCVLPIIALGVCVCVCVCVSHHICLILHFRSVLEKRNVNQKNHSSQDSCLQNAVAEATKETTE
ncbi:von Willebrand factor A domain-containing protein 3A isoform X3 [Hemicordylus capensis]|uniref:von Willebrand factor A domain-containing protein 3A isoform X3 n=1 Tax=Hemicordylus capensis TaxID=884348 RepID=UPI0023026E5B|nr:von Willebrand factor A domain-containing protein 3A isoform X3 [Hemicordylus capensis]